MARLAIWKGVVGFGMVAIPIKLYPATEHKDTSFALLHKSCHTRLRNKRFCPHHDVSVDQAEVVRGYQYGKNQYVVIQDGDAEDLPVSSLHTIGITRFVGLSEIDPMSFECSYILEPEGVGIKPFYLLKQALESTQRVAIAKVSLRQKEHICCLRPYDHALALHTMFYPDEIRGSTELLLPEEQAAITEQEIAMATTLIDQLTEAHDPSPYQDEYRLALERVVQGKLSAEQPVTAAPSAPQGKISDLMEALKASIVATKGSRDGAEPPPQEGERTKRGKEGFWANPR